MVDVIVIETPSLGDRSYLIHDGAKAIMVDPQRDIDRVQAAAAEAGVQITHIFETHIHNDYVTGGLQLAKETGAGYYVNEADPVDYERIGIKDGDVVEVSDSLSVKVIATPGHTFTHLSFAVLVDGEPYAVATGGSMLFGSTGRPDLLGPDNRDALVNHQYESAHRLATELPEHTHVLPTHGFGSFCSATQTMGLESTIGNEKKQNPVLITDRDEWIASVLAGLDTWPYYYKHMGPTNSAGPADISLDAPQTATKEMIAEQLRNGAWVVDLRNRQVFASGHVAKTFSIDIEGQFSTYLGWLIPWGTSLTLLGDSPEQIAEAQRELVRIGIDSVDSAATGKPTDWTDEELATLKSGTFADLADVRSHREVTILDTRRNLEWAAGHIDGAKHIPLHDLLTRIDEVPAGEVWVHCQSGYRASIGTSILQAAGHNVVWVDDSFDNVPSTNLPVTA